VCVQACVHACVLEHANFISYFHCLRASGSVHVCVYVCVISDFNILQHACNHEAPRLHNGILSLL